MKTLGGLLLASIFVFAGCSSQKSSVKATNVPSPIVNSSSENSMHGPTDPGMAPDREPEPEPETSYGCGSNR